MIIPKRECIIETCVLCLATSTQSPSSLNPCQSQTVIELTNHILLHSLSSVKPQEQYSQECPLLKMPAIETDNITGSGN